MGNVRSARDIDAALRKKGFLPKSDGKHIRYYLVSPDGTKMGIDTQMSHGASGTTIGSPLLSQMARQLRLTKAQFLSLIDCSMDEAAYRAILGEQDETV